MSNDDVITKIYKRLNELFGNKANQFFTMEYPGRILDQGTYAYEESNKQNSQQTKPQSVVEAEFRLSDDLFNLGELTGGPNGSKLSQVYSEVLNSLIPNGVSESSYEAQILPDQDIIAKWLIEDVPDWIPPPTDILTAILPKETHKHIENQIKDDGPKDPNANAASSPSKIPRIDLYQKLLDAYEQENFRWKQFLLNARPANNNDLKAWDDYNRTVAIYGPVVEKKLEALWTTLLVRGHYHRVRHYIGLIDVESSSESLQIAKSSMRESVMRSIDQTQDIYPVQFSPASWANFLSTDFEPVDLLMDPKLQREKLLSLQTERRALLGQKALLENGQPGSDLLKQLEGDVKKRREDYNKAQRDMTSGYTDAAFSLIQLYMRGIEDPSKVEKDEEKIKQHAANLKILLSKHPEIPGLPDIKPEDFNKLLGLQIKSLKLQDELTDSSEAYTRAQGQFLGAKASDASLAILQISHRIETLTESIEALKNILASGKRGENYSGVDEKGEEKEDANFKGPDGSVTRTPRNASLWQTVVISGRQSGSQESTTLTTASEAKKTNFNFWFGSYQESSNTSSGSSDKAASTYDMQLDIAFNVMKVTINRPWLSASVLQNTDGYYRINGDKKISTGTGWTALSNSAESQATKSKKFSDTQEASVLPAFPIAFLVAKDVSISFKNTDSENSASGEEIVKSASEGGGFLCFSSSSSSHSQSSKHASHSNHREKAGTIRMPGPQIIGWFLQSVNEDKTKANYTRFDPKTLPQKPDGQ